MAKKIRSSEIVQNDLFGSLGKSASEAQNKVDLLEASLEMIKQTAKQLSGKLDFVNPKDTASIREVNKLTGQANAIAKERTTINKRLIKEQTKLTSTTKQNREALAKTRLENQRANKVAKETVELKSKETGAYRKAAIQLARTSKALKDAVAGGKATKKEIKRLKNEFERASVKIRNADHAARDFRRNVGNYPKALGGARRALGALGLAFGGIALARNAIKTVADFEQSLANIRSFTDASTAEMDAFERKAKEIGETTQFTASQVAGLQFELAKLGFDPQDIINSTEPIANFAASVGVDLPEAATLAGSALRAFGLESKDMDRVTSVLGVATAKTALDFQKLQTGLSTVAPVAAAFGFSIEGTTALLGQLSNAGFDASSAATATRNILLNLADANGDLAKELGRPVESADDLAAALTELKDRGIDLGTALELTDKRSVAAFETFMEGAGSLSNLKEELTDVNDELARMAKDRMNTLQGDLKLLNSRWEAWLLGVNKTSGGLSKARKAIQFITRNLKTIIRVLKLVAVAWASWKLGQITTNVLNAGRGLVSMAGSLRKVKGATDAATTSQKGFNTAVKSNPIGLLLAALSTAVILYQEFASSAATAATAQERFNDGVSVGSEARLSIIEKGSTALNDQLKLIQQKEQIELKGVTNEKEIAKIRDVSFRDQKKLLVEANRENSILLSSEARRIDVLKEVVAAQSDLNNLSSFQNSKEKTIAKGRLVSAQKAAIAMHVSIKDLKTLNKSQEVLGVETGSYNELLARAAELNGEIKDIDHERVLIGKDVEIFQKKSAKTGERILEGSIAWYENLIKINGKKQKNLTLSSAEHQALEAQNNMFRLQIDLIGDRNKLREEALTKLESISARTTDGLAKLNEQLLVLFPEHFGSPDDLFFNTGIRLLQSNVEAVKNSIKETRKEIENRQGLFGRNADITDLNKNLDSQKNTLKGLTGALIKVEDQFKNTFSGVSDLTDPSQLQAAAENVRSIMVGTLEDIFQPEFGIALSFSDVDEDVYEGVEDSLRFALGTIAALSAELKNIENVEALSVIGSEQLITDLDRLGFGYEKTAQGLNFYLDSIEEFVAANFGLEDEVSFRAKRQEIFKKFDADRLKALDESIEDERLRGERRGKDMVEVEVEVTKKIEDEYTERFAAIATIYDEDTKEFREALKDKEEAEADYLDALESSNEKAGKQLRTQLLNDGASDLEITKALDEQRIKQLDAFILEKKKRGEDTTDEELELAELTRKTEMKAAEESAARRRIVIDLFTQYFIEQSDRRIKKIEEEIKAAERQAGVLAGLAASGNITAQQSLAQQDQIIAESNKRKEEEEKRKQRILLVSAVLQAYNSELAAGSTASEAFSKAITSTVVLERFVSALPTFFEGIEDTGNHGHGVDGRGGFKAILHPNERVLTAKQNAKTAGYSNEEVASIVEDHRAGSYIVDRGFMDGTSGGTKANDALVNEMKGVKKAIKEIPENNIELGRITQGYLLLNQTKKQGNRRTTNSFKVKP